MGVYKFGSMHNIPLRALRAALEEAEYTLVNYHAADPRTITVQSITRNGVSDVWTLGYEETD